MPTPPNYQKPMFTLHDPICVLCVFYTKDYCKKYDVPVEPDYACDSWKRNRDAPGW